MLWQRLCIRGRKALPETDYWTIFGYLLPVHDFDDTVLTEEVLHYLFEE